MSPFDKNYKSQIVISKAEQTASLIGQKSTARRERMMASDCPKARYAASGFIPGIGKSDLAVAEKIRRGSSKVGAGR